MATDKEFITERLFAWQGRMRILMEVGEVVELLAKTHKPYEAKKPQAKRMGRPPGTNKNVENTSQK